MLLRGLHIQIFKLRWSLQGASINLCSGAYRKLFDLPWHCRLLKWHLSFDEAIELAPSNSLTVTSSDNEWTVCWNTLSISDHPLIIVMCSHLQLHAFWWRQFWRAYVIMACLYKQLGIFLWEHLPEAVPVMHYFCIPLLHWITPRNWFIGQREHPPQLFKPRVSLCKSRYHSPVSSLLYTVYIVACAVACNACICHHAYIL